MFAILAISRGDVEAGIRSYERALEIQPDFPHSKNSLAATLNSLGRYEEAIGLLRSGRVRTDPMVTSAVPLADAVGVFEDLAESAGDEIKVIFRP